MSIYEKAKKFKKKYPMTVAWRLKQNSRIIEEHLESDEKVLYVFVGQKNQFSYDIFSTAVFAITNKRIVVGRKSVIFGSAFDSIMPYLFNDLNVRTNIIWGRINIDTVKEQIVISNIDKKAVKEIERNISKYMIELKKDYEKTKDK